MSKLSQTKRNSSSRSSSSRQRSDNSDRYFGTKLDREFGKYLQDRGLPSLAEILKVDK